MCASRVAPELQPARLRGMHRLDLDAVLGIERSSFEAPWPRSAFELAIAAPDLLAVVAENDAVLGYLIGCPDGSDLLVANVAVCPSARRRGIGTMLLRAAINRARREQLAGCRLDVRIGNLDAQRLYRGLGFEAVGIRERYYQFPLEDALSMRLPLDDRR